MNKVYLLMLCLLSTSFVGCLDTDEDETLEPLGTDENSDSSYESLKDEIKNLTKEIEKLHDDLKSLESYQYNPPMESTLTFRSYDEETDRIEDQFIVEKYGNNLTIIFVGSPPDFVNSNGSQTYTPWDNSTDCTGNQTSSSGQNNSNFNNDCDNDGIENYMDNCPFTANNNQKDSDDDGIGNVCDDFPNSNANLNEPCTTFVLVTIYNSNMDTIRRGYPTTVSDSHERNCNINYEYSNYGYYDDDFELAWSRAHFSLKEEPVRMEIQGQILTF